MGLCGRLHTWNENRKNANDVLMRLSTNVVLRALNSKCKQLGNTAIRVHTKQTIAICSFVNLSLQTKKLDFNFAFRGHRGQRSLLDFVENIDQTPDVRHFILEYASGHRENSVKRLQRTRHWC